MTLLKPVLHFSFFIAPLLIVLGGCSDKTPEEKPAPEPTSSVYSTEAELDQLQELINLPIKPVWIKWEVTKVTTPVGKLDTDDWSIVARMEVDKDGLKVLTTIPLPNKVTKLPAYTVKPWMEDVIATKFKLDENGEFYIPQGTMLSAEQFYRDPLLTGALYMISETEILLFLQTE